MEYFDMKKILLIPLLFIAFTTKAQDETFEEPLQAYIGASFNTTFDGYVGTSVTMLFKYNIAPKLSTRTKIGFYGLSIPVRDVPGVVFSLGVEYQYPWFYIFIDMYPHLDVHGIGHQAYGDYTSLCLEFNLGLGYRYNINKYHSLYLEAAIAQEVTIFNALREDYRDGTFPLLVVGYNYKFSN